ncbi:MAG: outer membrane protein assembly factor BamE [bacterium]
MKKSKRALFIYLFVAPLLFSMMACTAVLSGKSFDYQSVSKIEKGQSTKQDIRKLFREPLTIKQTETGEVWSYYVSEVGPLFNPTRSLDIYFNKSGIVTDYTYNEEKKIF